MIEVCYVVATGVDLEPSQAPSHYKGLVNKNVQSTTFKMLQKALDRGGTSTLGRQCGSQACVENSIQERFNVISHSCTDSLLVPLLLSYIAHFSGMRCIKV